MNLQDYVGRFARNVESGWLGKVVAVDNDLLRMQGVNWLCWQMEGSDINDYLDSDDTQWFVPEDLRFITLVEPANAS